MGEPFVGEIRIFAGNFAPSGWMFCSGQLLSIAQNDVLFTLIGTTYGGDGQSTFGLPDLQGRVPIHQGQGPGLSNRTLAERAGVESVTLTTNMIPTHVHSQLGSGGSATDTQPSGNLLATVTSDIDIPGAPTNQLQQNAVTPTGGSQPHANMQPYLGLSFIISLFGIYPSQN